MIEFRNITKIYAGDVLALNDVSFNVNAGELVVLIGPSGCGKTTALKMMNRLVEPTRGQIIVDGKDIAQVNPVELRRGIGYVIQQIGLFPHMTIAENVALVPHLRGIAEAKTRARVDSLLNLVGLPPGTFAQRYPRELSGGQQQRVGVARALAGDPTIVLMDEPFGAVDPITRRQLQEEMRKIQATVRKTIVFVTHDVSEAFLLGDRIGIMQAGHLLQLASPEELLRHPADGFVAHFIGGEGLWRKLDFLRVRDVVLALPAIGSCNWTCAQAIQVIEQHNVAQLLVTDANGRLAGQVTRETLMPRDGASVITGAVTPIPALPEKIFLKEALPCIASGRTEAQAVVDEDGRPIGLVTYRCLIDLFAQVIGKK